MTIIAYKDGWMAADSATFTEFLSAPIDSPKIIRSAGWLGGSAGPISATSKFRAWFLSGCALSQYPDLGYTDNEFGAIVAKGDGSLFYFTGKEPFIPIRGPYTVGEPTACAFVEGAMEVGASSEQAVSAAIRRCCYASGKIQIERLG